MLLHGNSAPLPPGQQDFKCSFQDQAGRLRDVVMGPDGAPYVTTSNCDGRGDCPRDRDKILRLLPSH